MRIEAITDVGLVRKSNEDSYLINERLGLFAVADGMGGHAAGEIASSLAVNTLEQAIVNFGEGEAALEQAIQQANQEIYRQSTLKPSLRGMGTTMTAVYFYRGKTYIGHVGDSRAYLINGPETRLLTRDHSLVGELVRCGQISEEEAKHHPQRHIVTRALGTEPEVQIDILAPDLTGGEGILLCTDGLSNVVETAEIGAAFRSVHDPATVLESLKQLALARGGHDNITAVYVQLS